MERVNRNWKGRIHSGQQSKHETYILAFSRKAFHNRAFSAIGYLQTGNFNFPVHLRTLPYRADTRRLIHGDMYRETGTGSQIQGDRYRETGTRSQIHGDRYMETGTGSQTHGERYRESDTSRQVQGDGYRESDTG